MADRAPIDVRLADLWVGTLYRKPAAVTERIAFRYADEWLAARDAFALDPELFLDARTTAPARGGVFGAFADCAPDRWGRRLMQRRERLTAETEGRAVRTLSGAGLRARSFGRVTHGSAAILRWRNVPRSGRRRASARASRRLARRGRPGD